MTNRWWTKPALPLAACMLGGVLIASGCQGLLYQLNSERRKKVTAECDKLADQRVAIIVWAEPSTLDADPFACSKTAESIAWYLKQNAGKRQLKGTTFVDVQAVTDLQEQLGNTGMSMANDELARRLKADLILRVDLFEYTTQAPEAQGLIAGRVGANVSLHRMNETAPMYRSEVSASFPENSRLGVLDKSEDEVLNATLAAFGERVARKFYDHEVEYD